MKDDKKSLASFIEAGAASAPAFIFEGTPVSRGEFKIRIDETTNWLAALGIGKGDVINMSEAA
jgi:fatty-acyl-CoA synthase